MDKSQLRPQLVAGTREPGGTGWPWNAQIPPSLRTRVVAVFNGGFRLREANGGFMVNGRVGVPLRNGAASLVIHRNGSVDVGSWNRGVKQDGTVVAVRQNLQLIVDHGKPVAGLRVNAGGAWGSAKNQLQYTWRSALGVDAHGNLVYVAGGGLNLQTLATAVSEAGAIRGMELEIHHPVVTCNLYEPAPGHTNKVVARKLLPDMSKPATRYLQRGSARFHRHRHANPLTPRRGTARERIPPTRGGPDASNDQGNHGPPPGATANRRADAGLMVVAGALTACWLTIGPQLTTFPRLLLLLGALGAHVAVVTALHRHESDPRVVLAIGTALLVLAVAFPPQGSKDLWAYAMQGRIVAASHHANPWVHAPTQYPDDPALQRVRCTVGADHPPTPTVPCSPCSRPSACGRPVEPPS